MKWLCIQNGAREHYVIPRALKQSGRLAVLFTEVWAGPVVRKLAFGPLRAMAARYHSELGDGRWKMEDRSQKSAGGSQLAEDSGRREDEEKAETLKTEKLKPDISVSAGQLSAFRGQIVSWNFSSAMREVYWRLQKAEMLKTGSGRQFRHPTPARFPDEAERERPAESGNQKSAASLSAGQLSAFAHERFIQDGRWFSEKVRDYLARRDTDLHGTVVFSYDTTALELFRWAKERGAVCVLGQMDPGRVEADLVREEEKRWPGWALRATEVPEEYFQRREREWALADRVVVNSEFSKQALIQQGVPDEKLVMVPLCYEVNAEKLKAEILKTESRRQQADVSVSAFQFSASSPLRVLFLGQVILRKGIQYLVEAAKLLQGEPVHFDVVGPIGISADAIKSAPRNMTFHGLANRDEAGSWYQRADVFVLPTLSDGFALTQLEAMAQGLPVVATPNCGEVVTNGKDGFIVPPRDAVSLAEAIKHYLARPDLLHEQKMAMKEKLRQFTLDKLAGRLLELENELERQSTKRQASVQNISP